MAHSMNTYKPAKNSCLITRHSRFAGIQVLALFWCISAFALTPGPTLIRECPGCQEPLKQYTIGSGNTVGAKFWTDGKWDAPMLPYQEPVVKCPKCSRLFLINKAKEIGRRDLWEEAGQSKRKWDPKWDKAPEPLKPSEEELLNFAETQKGLTTEEQVIVRRRAWWLANDGIRYNKKGAVQKFSERERKSLQALYQLLDEKIPKQLICKAEIARELGDFAACEQLLSNKLDEKVKSSADYIRKLAQKKDRLVRQYGDLD